MKSVLMKSALASLCLTSGTFLIPMCSGSDGLSDSLHEELMRARRPNGRVIRASQNIISAADKVLRNISKGAGTSGVILPLGLAIDEALDCVENLHNHSYSDTLRIITYEMEDILDKVDRDHCSIDVNGGLKAGVDGAQAFIKDINEAIVSIKAFASLLGRLA